MAMAVAGAQLQLSIPSVLGGLAVRPCSSTRRSFLSCRASSGGSRRDYEKILARQEKRRVRHMKGVTPSTPDLIKTLDSEKRDQAKLDEESEEVGDGETGLPLDDGAIPSPDVASEDDDELYEEARNAADGV